jgi:hypothetical protein
LNYMMKRVQTKNYSFFLLRRIVNDDQRINRLVV